MTILSSRNGTIEFGPGLPTLLINDQLRIMDQSPAVLAELQAGKLDKMLEIARFGQSACTDVADILVNHPGLDEVNLLPRIAAAVHEEVGCPISLDSRNPEALEAALAALSPYKALINSVTAESDSLAELLPIASRYGAAIVGMPIGHLHGMPKTVKGRVAEARVIVEAAAGYGISREEIVMDAICLASSAEPGSMQVTLETLGALRRELGVATILGIGNAGFGMPDQTRIDLAYLLAAVHWGLDAALVDPATPGLLAGVRAIDFLTDNDPFGRRYIRRYRAQKMGGEAQASG
jgi:5-methyltetrahydrofolate--homocysteine methyltransferase